MRLFTAGLLTESCTFSPIPTVLTDFDRADSPRGLGPFVRGMLDVIRAEAEAAGWEVITGLGAAAMPAGRVTADAYRTLKAELIEGLRAALPVDAVVLTLHGAMVAVGEDDCEGDILAEVRGLIGPGVALGVELDPHTNLSVAMVDNADLLVCYREWPHIDILERARDTVRLTMACAAGRVRPRMGVWDCRMIDLYHTLEEPMLSLMDQLRALEANGRALSASIIHGYPYCDVGDMGTKILVVTDDNAEEAGRVARMIGEQLFALRGRTRATHLPLAEGLNAVEHAVAPVIVADTADAPSGGAAGDATYLLRGLLDRGVEGVAVAYVHDPQATALAFAVGPGGRLPMRIGGKMGPASGDPLDLDIEVVSLHRDAVVGADGDEPVGDVALVRSRGVEILLSRDRPVAMDSSHFSAFGIDPRQRRVLVVKSVNNFRVGFEAVAGEFVYIAGPGSLDSSLRSYRWEHIQRPKWPLDPDPFGPGQPAAA